MEPQLAPETHNTFTAGTRDGQGAGDHDVPYRFGRRPTTQASFPFSTREFARLLSLRSRVQAGLFGVDDLGRPRRRNRPRTLSGQARV
jgi:hypothetical protein